MLGQSVVLYLRWTKRAISSSHQTLPLTSRIYPLLLPNRATESVNLNCSLEDLTYAFLYTFTFCTTKISYNTQTAVAVIPCSLHNMAVNTKNIDNIRDLHPKRNRSKINVCSREAGNIWSPEDSNPRIRSVEYPTCRPFTSATFSVRD